MYEYLYVLRMYLYGLAQKSQVYLLCIADLIEEKEKLKDRERGRTLNIKYRE